MAADTVCTIRDRIASRIGESRFNTWFGENAAFQLSDQRLCVTAPNAFVGDWIANNYLADLKAIMRDVVGDAAVVDVRVAPPKTHVASHGPLKPAPVRHRPPTTCQPPAPVARKSETRLRGELDAFVVGPSNQLAFSAAQSVVRSPRDAFKPLFIHGGCGLGKTHLLQGICNGVRQTHPTMRWCYISGEEFTNEYIYAVKSGRVDAFRARFRKVDLLVIDDIHFIADKRATQEEFLHTFNAIDGEGRLVILSSDRHPRSIGALSEPLTNRLISGMVAEIEAPDYTVRREILRQRVSKMSCQIPADVLDFVADNVRRNVRELEGAVFKLAAFASLMRERVTLDLVREVLQDYLAPLHGPLQPEDLIRVAAQYFGVTLEDVRSASRDRTVSLARAVAMFLLRRRTTMSFPEIGRALAKKNHTTAVMAVQRVEQTLNHDRPARWRTPKGARELPMTEVIQELERNIERQGR